MGMVFQLVTLPDIFLLALTMVHFVLKARYILVFNYMGNCKWSPGHTYTSPLWIPEDIRFRFYKE